MNAVVRKGHCPLCHGVLSLKSDPCNSLGFILIEHSNKEGKFCYGSGQHPSSIIEITEVTEKPKVTKPPKIVAIEQSNEETDEPINQQRNVTNQQQTVLEVFGIIVCFVVGVFAFLSLLSMGIGRSITNHDDNKRGW